MPVYIDNDLGSFHGDNNSVRDHILNNNLSGWVEMLVTAP